MIDYWATRDLPVLKYCVEQLQDPLNYSGIKGQAIAEAVGIDVNNLYISLNHLEDAGLIHCMKVMGPAGAWRVSKVSAQAMHLVGAWPTAGSLAARILSELENAASTEPDEETSSKLRRAAVVLGSAARDTGTNVLAAVLAKAMGIAP